MNDYTPRKPIKPKLPKSLTHEQWLETQGGKGWSGIAKEAPRVFESRPTRGHSFPMGVPDFVDLDTRLYSLPRPEEFEGTEYDHIITRYDRESGVTEAYLTSAQWDFSRHGPMIERVISKTAAHRRVMERLGYIVVDWRKR